MANDHTRGNNFQSCDCIVRKISLCACVVTIKVNSVDSQQTVIISNKLLNNTNIVVFGTRNI